MANTAALIRHIIINERSFIFNRKTDEFCTIFMKKVRKFHVCHAEGAICIIWQGRDGMSLTELRSKDVVNVDTGKKLGKVMDIEFDAQTGCVQAIVVPGEFKISCAIRGEKNGIIIPWERIVRIGDDVILVRFLPGEMDS